VQDVSLRNRPALEKGRSRSKIRPRCTWCAPASNKQVFASI
jgi:hypothetical protein